jgi:hypothetical protein
MTEPRNRTEQFSGIADELCDLLSDAITDSLDQDWSPKDGAKYCVEALLYSSDICDRIAATRKPSALVEAITGISDDYMTSENHHPGYVLIPTLRFEKLCAAETAWKASQ